MRMLHMKSIASLLSIIALGFGLVGCPGSGGGGGSSSAFAVSTTSANFGVVDSPYTSTLVATGGTAPLTWAFVGGTLPTGLGLTNTVTGEVTGIPTPPASNFTATFTVTDSTGKTATGSVLFAIHPRMDRVSVDNNVVPIPGTGLSSAPSISADGRYVAFVSVATNLLAPDPVVLGGQQIYIHDRQLGQSSLASQDNTNTNVEGAGGVSDTPSMNSNGGFVAFFSQATNLTTGSGAHIYVRAIP